MSSIQLGAMAKQDIAQAKAWYLSHGHELAQKFAKSFSQTLENLILFPESHPIIYRDVRRAHLKDFPYAILYFQRPDHWQILGVVHLARDPQLWKRRR